MEVLMAAPKGNKFALDGNGGRPSKYKADYAAQARKACETGFTDKDLADLFGVSRSTINLWKLENKEFSAALKIGKEKADDQVERSLYYRALGYSYDAVKVFMPANSDKPVLVPYQRMYRRTHGVYFLAEESAAGAVAGPARSPAYSGDENRGTVARGNPGGFAGPWPIRGRRAA
jgi:hypothetical protein